MTKDNKPVLGIECTTTCGSVAVVDGDGVLASHTLRSRVNHSIRMLPVIEQLLKETDLQVCDLAAIAVSQGPGSFTGVRIGISTAKGLAKGAGIPLLGISTLEAMARANFCGADTLLCPMINARRGNVFTALYQVNQSMQMTEKIASCILSVEDLLPRIETPTVFIGDGALAYWEQIENALGTNAIQAKLDKMQPSASSVAALGRVRMLDADFSSEDSLMPIYLRQTYAKPSKYRNSK